MNMLLLTPAQRIVDFDADSEQESGFEGEPEAVTEAAPEVEPQVADGADADSVLEPENLVGALESFMAKAEEVASGYENYVSDSATFDDASTGDAAVEEAPETEEITATADVASEPQKQQESPMFSHRHEAAALEDRIAELEAAVSQNATEWEPDGSEPEEIHRPKLRFLEMYRRRYGDASESLTDYDGDEENAPAPTLRDIEPMTIRPSAPDDEAPAAEASPPEPPLKLEEVAVFSHTPRHFPEPAEPPVADPVVPKVEAVAPPQREPEPETLADIAPHPATEEPDYAVLAEEAGGELWASEDEFLVDEEVLRKVVSDIVRDELQGRLGERITRNVRRMIRQEIERAMAIKSLE